MVDNGLPKNKFRTVNNTNLKYSPDFWVNLMPKFYQFVNV